MTDESTAPRTQEADILFDLHKREADDKDEDSDEEVVSIAHFLEVKIESEMHVYSAKTRSSQKNEPFLEYDSN